MIGAPFLFFCFLAIALVAREKDTPLLIITFAVLLCVFLLYFTARKRAILRKIAIDTVTAFNYANVNYWVDYGTLLGIFREKDIIRHDTDVDICMLDTPENHEKVLTAFNYIQKNSKPFPYLDRFFFGEFSKYSYSYFPWGAYRVCTGPFHADIYITKQKGVFYVDPTGQIPIELVGNTTVLSNWGIPIRVPEQTKDALVWRYGKDFMTPKQGRAGQAVDGK